MPALRVPIAYPHDFASVPSGWAETSEQFSQQWSISNPAFAEWWMGSDDSQETVNAYTVLGLSAVLRAVMIISTTIAALPLRTFERHGEERVQVPSVFDDPYPGIDGQTPFAWVETILMHLLLWREAFLWHEERSDIDAFVTVYRPIIPEAFEPVKRVNGKRVFTFTETGSNERKTVGSESITYIPGPSLDGIKGHPLLYWARSIFSAAISGDKSAQTVLKRGIRLAGLVTPSDGEDDFPPEEAAAILEQLRATALGPKNAGDIAVINRKLKLSPWTPTNIDSQWHETRGDVLGEVGRIFGIPPHLLNDIEKQTSWGTGVSEQNLGLARFTLMGWSSRIEQVLSMRLPNGQFCEFDYTGLLQGTPAEEIKLLLLQTGLKPFLTVDEARKVRNLPPLTDAQKAELATVSNLPGQVAGEPSVAASVTTPDRMLLSAGEVRCSNCNRLLAERAAPPYRLTCSRCKAVNDSDQFASMLDKVTERIDRIPSPTVTIAEGAMKVDVHAAPVTVHPTPAPNVTFEAGSVAPVTQFAEGALTLIEQKPMRTVYEFDENGDPIGDRQEVIKDD